MAYDISKTEELSAKELQRILQDKIDAIRDVREDREKIACSLPTWCDAGDQTYNWDVTLLGEAQAYHPEIAAILEDARARYRLPRPR